MMEAIAEIYENHAQKLCTCLLSHRAGLLMFYLSLERTNTEEEMMNKARLQTA
jgi:hypothetical protein